MNNITIIERDYLLWIQKLTKRYRRSQIKAAVGVNREMLTFYWYLGHDIVEMHVEDRWGEKVLTNLSADLQKTLPNATGLSRRNIYYCKQFYELYLPLVKVVPQVEAQTKDNEESSSNASDKFVPQVEAQINEDLFSVPWGHHKCIMDKCKGNVDKALFYVHQTVENGWSRDMLLNFISTNLYERSGKSLNNFKTTLPQEASDYIRRNRYRPCPSGTQPCEDTRTGETDDCIL